MEFVKAMDRMPKVAKVILAIFVNIIWVIYRFVVDVIEERWTSVILDAIFCIAISGVFYLLNIIWTIWKGECFDFRYFYDEKASSKETKYEEKKEESEKVDVEVVDKK